MSRPRRYGRDIHGILLLDKPEGLSSNSALQKVKQLYNANHAGHTGTLDPLATGMLPICFGEATKFSRFLLNSNKLYRVIAKLGQRTDTSDATGQVVKHRPVHFTSTQLNAALNKFRGNLQQIPSMYSALKYQGKKLYEYARKGINVPRKSRHITVYQLQIIHWEQDTLELEIYCSKGTYIRTIIDDLGELLGCGAHVSYLRRLHVTPYPTERMVTLQHLQALLEQAQAQTIALNKLIDPLLIPIDSVVNHYPEINLSSSVASNIKQGRIVQVITMPTPGIVRITEGKERNFIGIGVVAHNGLLAPQRLVINYKSTLN
ncbi:tRNA pseudouridine(55) synthase TruB [Candidatus Gillettellia adelgis]